MQLLSRPHTGVGLDVGVDVVRAVILRRSRNQWAVLAAGSAPLPSSSGFAAAESDPTIASAVTAELMKRLRVRKALVTIAVSARDAVVRRLVVPRSSRKALAAAVRAAAADDLPATLALAAPLSVVQDGTAKVVPLYARLAKANFGALPAGAYANGSAVTVSVLY